MLNENINNSISHVFGATKQSFASTDESACIKLDNCMASHNALDVCSKRYAYVIITRMAV